tara:strand:- start:17 stop:4240 length:4224 start_codon:yes stop_codon:yes gene_type:complete
MPQSVENSKSQEGFEIVNTQGTGVTVQLPNKFRVTVQDTKSGEEALNAASVFYENQKQERGKDEVLFTDLLVDDKRFINLLRQDYAEIDNQNQTKDWYKDPELLIRKFARDRRFKEGNTAYALKGAVQSFGKDTDQKKRAAYLANIWDSMPDFYETGGSGFSGLMENIEAGVTDPVTVLSFLAAPFTGGGSVAANFAAKKAIGAGLRSATNQAMQRSTASQIARSTAIYGGIDYAASAGFSYLNQLERVNINMQDEIDYGKVVIDGAIGAAASTAISIAATGAVRLKPVRRLTESQQLKNFTRKIFMREHASDFLTTHTRLGREGSYEVRTGQGDIDAFQFEILTVENRVKSTILKAEGVDPEKVSWEQWLAKDPENGLLLNRYVNAFNKDNPQVNKELAGLEDLDARSGEPPAAATTGELDDQLLLKNPEVREAIEELVAIQVPERAGVIDLTIGKSPFESTQTLHSTRRYEAFENGDANLVRLKESPAGQAKFNNAMAFIKQEVSKRGGQIGNKRAEEVVNFIALGKLEQALRKLQNNRSVLGGALGDEDFIAQLVHGRTLDDLDNAATSGKGTKGKKDLLTPVAKERVDMPPEIREILGEIDDPITGALEATYRLGVVRRKVETDQRLLESLIRTGQIDRLGVDTTILDTPLANINKKIILPSGAKVDVNVQSKTLRQAVKDGDISGVEQFKIITENSKLAKDAAFEQAVNGGKIFNPLGLVYYSNEFDEAFNQAAFGASFTGGDGIVGNILQAGYKLNYVSSSSKTVYSLSTQWLNQIGGFTSYTMMNGVELTDFNYIRKSYLPMFTEVLQGHINKENKGKMYSRLIKKGYSQKQVDDVLQDFRELLRARIIDSDFLTDFERTLTAEGKLAKFGKGLYDKTGVIKVGNEFTKRAYAASDEMYKVLMYKNQKQKFMQAGFTSSEAIRYATQDVLDFMPNYRFIPKIFKIGRFVGVGAFLSHTVEITRNFKNLYVQSGKRIVEGQRLINSGEVVKGRALRRDAMARLGRATAILGGVSYFADEINSVLGGEKQSEKENLAINVFSPEFYRGDNPVITKKDGDGNLLLFHPNRVFAFGPLAAAFTQVPVEMNEEMAKGASIEDAGATAAARAFLTAGTPLFSKAPGTKALIEFFKNPGDEEAAKKLILGTAKALNPGIASDITKAYKILSRDAKGGLGKAEYERGPDGKPMDLAQLGRKQLGMRESRFNIGASAEIKYRKAKIKDDQNKFSSYFNFSKFSEDIDRSGDILGDMSQTFDGLNLEFLEKEGFEKIVEAFVDANNERFLQQRELYFLFVTHANYLSEQENYKGNKDAIFDEVYKRAIDAKISQEIAGQLVEAAVYPSEMPRYEPFMITQANMDKSVEGLIKKGMAEEEAYRLMDNLYQAMENAIQPMRNQSLNTRIKDE